MANARGGTRDRERLEKSVWEERAETGRVPARDEGAAEFAGVRVDEGGHAGVNSADDSRVLDANGTCEGGVGTAQLELGLPAAKLEAAAGVHLAGRYGGGGNDKQAGEERENGDGRHFGRNEVRLQLLQSITLVAE